MSAIMEEIAVLNSGVNKRDFEASLEHVSNQIRWIEQKLTMKVDNEIWQSFQNQQKIIDDTKSMIRYRNTLQIK